MGHLDTTVSTEYPSAFDTPDGLGHDGGAQAMHIKKRRMTAPHLNPAGEGHDPTATHQPESDATSGLSSLTGTTLYATSNVSEAMIHAGLGAWSAGDHSPFLLANADHFAGPTHVDPAATSLTPGATTDYSGMDGRLGLPSAPPPTAPASFASSVEGLAFSPGSDPPRPLPPRVNRVLSHRSPLRGSRLSSKKPRSLSLAFVKTQGPDGGAGGDLHTQSPGPTTPAMFSPSFLDALNTPTAPDSPMLFNFSSPGVEHNPLIHSSDLGLPEGLHSPAHMPPGFGQHLDPATMDPASLSMGHHNGAPMPYAAMPTLRNRMGSLNQFANPYPTSPLSPHTPVGDGGMMSNLMSMTMQSFGPPPPGPSPHPHLIHPMVPLSRDISLSQCQPSSSGFVPSFRPEEDEKCIVIMTPKVAQKSYGSEKRFLCPPPTVLLLGANWLMSPYHVQPSGSTLRELLKHMGPMVQVSIPEEGAVPQPPTLDWMGEDLGLPYTDQPRTATVTGRSVSKNLYINEADEKRKRVKVQVKLQTPHNESIGSFLSKPIKVISKPSKKRQSLKNIELCIHHGTTISLFNRLRSQTVSTKYLGVQNSIASGGPCPDWSKANDIPTTRDQTSFVARTNTWDPFIIWIVDQNQPYPDMDSYPNLPPAPGYPPPPAMAIHPRRPPELPDAEGGSPGTSAGNGDGDGNAASGCPPIPIHYNQTVVLQCLSTGMVSPVMIIRKAEKGSLVSGGNYANELGKEYLGDPVSQLHKVAFELKQTITQPHNFPNGDRGSYLACLGDAVGTHASPDGKKLSPHLATPPNSTDGEISPTASTTQMLGGVGQPFDGFGYGNPGLPPASMGVMPAPVKPASAKSFKRGSMSRSASHQEHAANSAAWVEDANDSAIWTIVSTEFSQYTFKTNVTTPATSSTAGPPSAGQSAYDMAPLTPGGTATVLHPHSHPGAVAAGGGLLCNNNAALTPSHGTMDPKTMHSPYAASFNGGMAMGIPTVTQIIVSDGSQSHHSPPHSVGDGSGNGTDGTAAGGGHASMQSTRPVVTVVGDSFTPHMSVWFGNQPSTHTEFRSPQVLLCFGPVASDFGMSMEAARGMSLPIMITAGNGHGGDKDKLATFSTGHNFTL
ncbi:hypothetical protein H4R34_004409 [Dimargaris verticillata]|uniref:LAG1-DNAbind-domain-containing protein n=1 Tax=Dimargaris verticillata TaxID=2761393 RepID=A0A9W8B4D5_9FUNG|nr:hypothetical protein H4R34_004409 [Dimargaris verticillata]